MDSTLDRAAKERAPRRGVQLLRFVAAGAANTLISLFFYQAALFFIGHLAAYVLAYAMGVVIAYYLYARHVFAAHASARGFVVFAAFYTAAGCIGSFINAGLIDVFGWHARIAIFATILLMLPVTYLGSRWCVLGTPHKNKGPV